MRSEIGKEMCWSQTTEELENLDAAEIHGRRLNAKEVLMSKNGETFYFPTRRWNSANCLQETSESENPPQSRITLHETKTVRMTRTPETIFGTIEGNYIYRHHVQYHCDILTWPGEQTLLWASCWKAVLKITGTLMAIDIYRIHGPDSRSSHY